MADDDRTVREIAWREIFPWLILVRTFRLSIQVKMLVLASVGLLVTILGWWLIGLVFSGSDESLLQDPALGWIRGYASCPWTAGKADVASALDIPAPDELSGFAPPKLGELPANPYLGPWAKLAAPVRQLFHRQLTFTSLAFLLLCILWAAAVWALAGGAITRVAAVQLGREENVPLKSAIQHARSKWLSYFAAPLFPLLGVLFPTLGMLVAGLIMRADLGAVLMGLIWPLLLLGGLLMIILLVGLLFGWPLMYSTISTEGTDSFDALSRSYSYVYQRPLQYLFYALVASLLGLLGLLVVTLFAEGVIHMTQWAVSWGSGNSRMQELEEFSQALGRPGAWAANLLFFWHGLVHLVVLGFAYSYFWTANSAIYLLLRRDVDGTEMDEVFVEDVDERYGLPPLSSDESGVPIVSPDEDAADQGDSPEPPEAEP